MLIKSVRGYTPAYGSDCFFAENATVIGDVILGDEVSVWYQAVIRGDVNAIRIGNKVNIQDGVVIHATFETAPTHIGNNVSILPMPTKTLSCNVQPCTIALWPIDRKSVV